MNAFPRLRAATCTALMVIPVALPSSPPPDSKPATAPTGPAPSPAAWMPIPVAASWMRVGRRTDKVMGNALRYALWEDGRFVFATDAAAWGSPLREGRLSPDEVRAVLKELGATGVLDLPGHCYLVPDSPMLATMVRVAGREQVLYWDEVDLPNHGLNIQAQPHHVAFKNAWRAVNAILARHVPGQGKPVAVAFAAPEAWYVKPAIQSK